MEIKIEKNENGYYVMCGNVWYYHNRSKKKAEEIKCYLENNAVLKDCVYFNSGNVFSDKWAFDHFVDHMSEKEINELCSITREAYDWDDHRYTRVLVLYKKEKVLSLCDLPAHKGIEFKYKHNSTFIKTSQLFMKSGLSLNQIQELKDSLIDKSQRFECNQLNDFWAVMRLLGTECKSDFKNGLKEQVLLWINESEKHHKTPLSPRQLAFL